MTKKQLIDAMAQMADNAEVNIVVDYTRKNLYPEGEVDDTAWYDIDEVRTSKDIGAGNDVPEMIWLELGTLTMG